MIELARRFLSSRGVHYLATRFGNTWMRSLSFDGKFDRGLWVFSDENPDFLELVERFSARGHILALGCGTASVADKLKPESFRSFLGVDLSTEAIRRANERANEKIRFEVGDMLKHRCERPYDVILFSNSLNYVNWGGRKRFLRRLTQSLTSGGRIVVSLAQPKRYAGLLKMIRRAFVVDVDRELEGQGGHVIVFR